MPPDAPGPGAPTAAATAARPDDERAAGARPAPVGARLRRAWRPPRRLRFAREGKYFVGISVGIGFAAVNTANNLLYLLLGWMLSVIVASGVLSELTLRRLRVTRHPPPRIHAGAPVLMGITLANGKRRLPSFSIEVEDLVIGPAAERRCFFLKVPAGATQSTSYRHIFPRRGLVRYDGFRVATRFPFSLFRKSRELEAPGEVVVYPAVHPIALPQAETDRHGDEARVRRGRRGEFHGLREFREGDDRRDVHWRSSARLGRMVVREYEEERHRQATVVADNALDPAAGAAGEEELEREISRAASLATEYVARGYAVRLVARGASVPPASGPAHLARILRTLALLPGVPPATPFQGTQDLGGQVPRSARAAGAPGEQARAAGPPGEQAPPAGAPDEQARAAPPVTGRAAGAG